MTEVLLDKAAIEAVIPHRYPMLLIDEVIELVPGRARRRAQDGTRRRLRRHFPATRSCPA